MRWNAGLKNMPFRTRHLSEASACKEALKFCQALSAGIGQSLSCRYESCMHCPISAGSSQEPSNIRPSISCWRFCRAARWSGMVLTWPRASCVRPVSLARPCELVEPAGERFRGGVARQGRQRWESRVSWAISSSSGGVYSLLPMSLKLRWKLVRCTNLLRGPMEPFQVVGVHQAHMNIQDDLPASNQAAIQFQASSISIICLCQLANICLPERGERPGSQSLGNNPQRRPGEKG